jgi:hypothetical protein
MRSSVLPVPDACQTAWAAHIREVFSQIGLPADTLADHLVTSISIYCKKFHPQGLQAHDLNLLIARACCAVGERTAAAQVLESMPAHRRHVERWLEILSELHHFPQLLPYFSRGIIRPADWAGAQLDRMWTLDFGRLMLSDADRHEMALYRSIRALIEKMSVFWEATRGEGILGLKELAALNLATRSKLTSTEALLEYMTDLLTQQKTARNWISVPVLLNLDL